MNWIPRSLRFSPEYRTKRREEDTFKRESYKSKMKMLADIRAELFHAPPVEDNTGEQSLQWKYLAEYNVAV